MSEICQICNLGFESTTTNFCTTKECFHNFHTNCLLLYSVQSTKHSVHCPYPDCDKLICEEDEQTEDRERSDSMPSLIDEEQYQTWQSETQLLEESMSRASRRDSDFTLYVHAGVVNVGVNSEEIVTAWQHRMMNMRL